MLETIARLLPFMVLGLIGLFVVVLLNEVSKQQKKTTRKFPASSSIQSILVELVKFTVAGILLYGVLKLNLSSYEIMFIMFMWAAMFGASQEPTQQQKQPYQRIPVVHPKKQSQPKTEKQQRVLITPPKHTQTSSAKSIHSSLNNSSIPSKPSSPKRGSIFQRQQVNPLQPKLLAMMNGNRDGAERLLSHAKQNNPGMSETWYFEKVIADLERDRR